LHVPYREPSLLLMVHTGINRGLARCAQDRRKIAKPKIEITFSRTSQPMPFVPKYSHQEVDRIIADGGLSLFEIYRLKHQHPINRLMHVVGTPIIAASIAFPLFAWFEWGVVAWKEAIILSAVGWSLQFLGHVIEGNQPAFFQNPRFLIVGATYFLFRPLWLLCRPLRRVLARLTGRSAHG